MDIGANTKGFKQGVESASQKLKDFGKSARRIGRRATLGITTPILAAGTAASSFASSVEEMQAKSETVFKDSIRDVRQWSKRLGERFNRSRFLLERLATSFQDILVPMGFARDEAADLSQKVSELAVDVASFNNEAAADVARNFQSALVGQSRAVLQYGINAKQAAVEQQLLNMGIQGGIKAASEQEKIMARIKILMQDSADAQGDAARTADSFANTLRGLKGAAKDTAIAFGQILNPFIKRFVQKFVRPAVDFVRNLSEEKKQLIVRIAGIAAAVGPALIALGALATVLGVALPAVLSPLGVLFATVLGGIAAEIASFWDNNKTITQNLKDTWSRWEESVKGTWESAKKNAKFVFSSITAFWERHRDKVFAAGNAIKMAVKTIFASLRSFWENHKKSIVSIGKGILGFFKEWGKFILDTFLGIIGSLVDTGASLIGWLQELPTPVKSAIGGLAGFALAVGLISKALSFVPFLGTIRNFVFLQGVISGTVSPLIALVGILLPATRGFLALKIAAKGLWSLLGVLASALGISTGGLLAIAAAAFMVIDAWDILAGEFKLIAAGVIRWANSMRLSFLELLAQGIAPILKGLQELGFISGDTARAFGEGLVGQIKDTKRAIKDLDKVVQESKKQISKGQEESLTFGLLSGLGSAVGSGMTSELFGDVALFGQGNVTKQVKDMRKQTDTELGKINKDMVMEGTESIVKAFRLMKKKIVGNSIVPEMNKEIRNDFSRTLDLMSADAKKGAKNIGKTLSKADLTGKVSDEFARVVDLSKETGKKIGKTLFKGAKDDVKDISNRLVRAASAVRRGGAGNVPALEKPGSKPILERTPSTDTAPLVSLDKKSVTKQAQGVKKSVKQALQTSKNLLTKPNRVERGIKKILMQIEQDTTRLVEQGGQTTEVTITLDGETIARRVIELTPGEKFKMGAHPR